MQQYLTKKLINCDLGECLVPNPDKEVMPLIDMANIACGGHAGDNESIVDAINLAKKNNVKIGSHPSYMDKSNFGRVSHNLSDSDLYDCVYSQIANFQKLCVQNNAKLDYVKPHGALYHDMTHQQSVLGVICRVIQSIDSNLSLVVQAGNEERFKNIEKNENINFLYEVFADRGYKGMHMIARGEKGAILDNSDDIIDQFWRFFKNNSIKLDTICFHGDNKASVEALKQLKHA